ncbi:molecular chaperone DnaJ, partial [Escherichia coli]|nr:molecular chaperone DnaJ [Escherichia coli]
MNKATECGTCHGSGNAPNSKPKRCTSCGGTGRVQMRQAVFLIESSCQQCGGTGKIQDPCGT